MSNKNNEKVKLTGKGKKANKKLNSIRRNIVDNLCKKLCQLREILIDLIDRRDIFDEIDDNAEIINSLKKLRSAVKGVPERLEFISHQLRFYIDFTIIPSESDDPCDIKGCIIYGVNKSLCFEECIFPSSMWISAAEKNKENEDIICKNCERIMRCDRLEDRPLIKFNINQRGMIRSTNQLEDEWWIDEKSDIAGLHYRALDHIWKDALNWTNEKILP